MFELTDLLPLHLEGGLSLHGLCWLGRLLVACTVNNVHRLQRLILLRLADLGKLLTLGQTRQVLLSTNVQDGCRILKYVFDGWRFRVTGAPRVGYASSST